MGRMLRTRLARTAIVGLAAVGASAVGLGAVGATTPPPAGPAGVAGTVLDDTTLPAVAVDGVEVCLEGPGTRVCATTQTDGRFAFSGVATGSYELTATPPAGTAYLPVGGTGAYVPVPAVVVDLVAGTQVQDLHLVKGGGLEVTVLEPDGVTRAAGQPVSVCRTDDGGPGACPDAIDFPATDALGQSVGPALLPGVYRIRAGVVTTAVGAATADDVIVEPETTTTQRVRRVDLAPPVVTGTPTGLAGANGWFRSAVTVTWTVVDPAPSSGLRAPLPAPSTFGTEGANTFLSDEAYDNDGNHAAGSILLKIDTIAPVVTCPTDVHFALNQTRAALTATVSDPTAGSSGPEAATVSAPVDSSVAGPGSASVTGRDLAGNETTVSCGYVVDPPTGYRFQGFSWPIDNGTINVVRSGRNVPLAWRLTDANGRGVTNPASLVSLASVTISCPAARSDLVELTLPVAQPPRPVGGGFWFGTWKAPAAVPGSCTELRLAFDDGSVRTAVFRIVK